MNKIYGYCRISNKEQNIERQIRNIRKDYPDAVIMKEAFTGTKVEGRKEFQKLLRIVKENDTIVFDSVSRMSRNAEDGTKLYFALYDKGINLVFLKESYINTDVYKVACQHNIPSTGNDIADIYIAATNKVIKLLAAEQIKKAFEQSQKEVDDLRQRTKEGMETAKINGKQIGQKPGTVLITKKSIEAKEIIKMNNKDFDGNLNDINTMALLVGKLGKMSRNSFYKYKRDLLKGEDNGEKALYTI